MVVVEVMVMLMVVMVVMVIMVCSNTVNIHLPFTRVYQNNLSLWARCDGGGTGTHTHTHITVNFRAAHKSHLSFCNTQ